MSFDFDRIVSTLSRHGVAYVLIGGAAAVAALDDIITSKRAANRPKDRAGLPYLEALADEIARGG